MPPLTVKQPLACPHCEFDDIEESPNLRQETRICYLARPRPEELPEWEEWDDEREVCYGETVLACVRCGGVVQSRGRSV